MSFGVCNTGRSNSWILILVAAILAGLLIFFLLTTAGVTAFANVFNTTAVAAVAAGDPVPFTAAGPLENITFTAPDTLTLGPTAGGTYLVQWSATPIGVNSNFAVTVNGVVQPSTAAGILLAVGVPGIVSQTAEIVIPSGATVQLVNTGLATVLTNLIGGVAVPSAQLNLVRIGPVP